MSTTYPVAADQVRTTVSSYTISSGSIIVASVSGFPTPSSSAPILFTVISQTTYGTYPETYCTYRATTISGTTISGMTVVDGTDTAWVTGDYVEMRVNALHLNGPATAVQASILTVNAETSLPNSIQLALTTTGTNGAATLVGGTLNVPQYSGGGGNGVPGGTSGQIQWNNSNTFGGFTAGGDATINTTNGAVVVGSIGGKAIALGGALTTSGAFSLTFTTTNNSSLTLPTTGTVAVVPGTNGQLAFNNNGALGGASNLTVGTNGQLNLAAIAAPGSPVNGDQWHDSTQKCLTYYGTGLASYRNGLIYIQTANVTVTASGASSLVSTTGAVGTVNLPSGFLNVLGRSLHIKVFGYGTSAASSPGTIYFSAKMGSNVIASNVAIALNTSRTNQSFLVDLLVTTTTTGASGTLDSNGMCIAAGGLVSAVFQIQNSTSAGSSAPGTPVTLDLTAAYTIDFLVTLSTTTNSISATHITIEVQG